MQSLRTFVAVAEARSFARAAERLDLSNAAVTRHVASLEERLGGRLFQRTTRNVRLTDVGEICLERFTRLLAELDDTTQLVNRGTVEPQGVLRVSSTTLFWMQRIAPVLSEFLIRYPKLALHVHLTERSVDIVEEGYDLALQITRPHVRSIVAKPILHLQRAVYAAPSYLNRFGAPRRPTDLASHNCLLYAYSGEVVEWGFRRAGREERVKVEGNLRSSDASTLRLAALAGVGIARGPFFILGDDLESGRLVHLLTQYESIDPELWVVYPSRRQLSAKVRAFVDFLEEKFRDWPSAADLRTQASSFRADSSARSSSRASI
ncbi:MAG: LysR family transcriptional regulator [Burkholderiales bacterium]|nr:LysR family transcriptional regulator [Burkholderiales bacterium]